MRCKTTKKALIRLANSNGVQLEFNKSWVREFDEEKWIRRMTMYHRLYQRMRRSKSRIPLRNTCHDNE